MRQAACIALITLALPRVASADDGLGHQLADPREGTLVLLRSGQDDDRAVLTRAATATGDDPATLVRCGVPCSARVTDGVYEVRFASGPTGHFAVHDLAPRLVVGRPLDAVELGLGVASMVLGAGLLIALAGLADETCWRTDGTCELSYGPMGLGVGIAALALGVGLSIDSIGGVSVTALPMLHRR
ncbi:MAG: hypothetical protein AB7S26_13800 [Sandaracinaceae bacterium]